MTAAKTEHVDVLIVGAGISGIGTAHHLQRLCPDLSYLILEGRERIGGTWDLFRYPGIRSDSDMFTLGYGFKPWKSAKAIADGPAILEYLDETVSEAGIDQHIRFSQHVQGASWDSGNATWTIRATDKQNGEEFHYSCSFLSVCSGYYNYEEGHQPSFPGEERFTGEVLHPQFWPEDFDYQDKNVVVIGSGATAVTLVPAMADDAKHVTMLQRSPSYVVERPQIDRVAQWINRLLPTKLAHRLNRWKNVLLGIYFYNLCQNRSDKARTMILDAIREELGEDYPVDTHFSPSYKPWDQRMCLVPDGDLFQAIKSGKAAVATDQIDTFTESGIQLASGEHLDADVIVTATGLKLQLASGMRFTIDGDPRDLGDSVVYKGMMFSGFPNLAMTFGYTNASWTLKADLIAKYTCRLLNHMKRTGHEICMAREADPNMEHMPFLNLTSGYVRRSMDQFPRQGTEKPWRLYQNYIKDSMALRWGRLEDGVMQFHHSGTEERSQTQGPRPLAKAS